MRVLVCGGREFSDRDLVYSTLDRIHAKFGDDLIIITGAQHKRKDGEFVGADYLAEEWAKEREVEYMGFPARWTRLGKRGGYERNNRMKQKSAPDAAVAFPGGPGTEMMCGILREAGIEPWRIGQ